jgi:hypothetical protein
MAALPPTAKEMPELSMLTYLIEAAAAVKHKDGDTSMHGYAENLNHGQEMTDDIEVDFAVLDSISDVLLQSHQVLAISPDKRERERGLVTTLLMSEAISESDFPAEPPISEATTVTSISATVVPNPNDRNDPTRCKGPLGNLRQVTGRKSLWDGVKGDPLSYAVK